MKATQDLPFPHRVPDRFITTALVVVTIVSRLPFQAGLLDGADAVNYALALDHFDMRLHQPQPPGYPLYILLGRLFLAVLGDHRAALVWLSTVSSALGVLAVYFAGCALFDRRVGIMAAGLLIFSTSYWYLGEVAAPYTADLAFSALVGWLCYRSACQRATWMPWITAIALGLAGTFRLQTFSFLIPLMLYSLWRYPFWVRVTTLLLAGLVLGTFFVPAVMASGGPRTFWQLMTGVVPIIGSTSRAVRSIRWTRFLYNIITIARYTLAGLGEVACLLVPTGLATACRQSPKGHISRLAFLLIWLLPTWLTYLLIWPGNLGTIMVCLPPLCLLAALGLVRLMALSRQCSKAGWALLALVLILNTIIFTCLPEYPFGREYRRFTNYASLRERMGEYQDRLTLVQSVPVEDTLVYTSERYPQFYLPEYRIEHIPLLPKSQESLANTIASANQDLVAAVPSSIERLVLFDLTPEIVNLDAQKAVALIRNEHRVYVVAIPKGHRAIWTTRGLSISAHAQESGN